VGEFLETINSDWLLISPEEAAEDWNNWLKRYGVTSYHQLYEYGVVKQSQGWHVLRVINCTHRDFMTQVVVRLYPLGVAIGWIPGVNNWWTESITLDIFYKFLQATLNRSRLYLRFSFMDQVDGQNLKVAIPALKRPSVLLGSQLSMIYRPCVDEDERMQIASKNWRHNLRRSRKYNLKTCLWDQPDKDEIIELYSLMEAYKGLSQQYSPAEISAVLSLLHKNLLIIRCDNENGDLIAMRGCIWFKNKGWDFFAAASVEGRKTYASYICFWHLMNECRDRGIETYNFGGVDPENNVGVYNFMKGTGAQLIEYGGEYERCDSALLARLVNIKLGWGKGQA